VEPSRIALVVHPARPIDGALATLQRWARDHDVPLLQPPVADSVDRQVAPSDPLEPGDLVIALGGDGTVLSALRASAPVGAPVLGVSCGSLGALTVVPADRLVAALERLQYGDWTARRLHALAIEPTGAPSEWAVNDFVVVRRRAVQLMAEVMVDDELYARTAGDGVIVATPLGSSAYSMAAGGPLIVAGTQAIVVTPLAMHGGSAPPLVVPATSSVRLKVYPSYGGFDVEIDGHVHETDALEYRLSLWHEKVTLVSFGEPGPGLTALRQRNLIADSPRMLARDARAARDRPEPPSPRSGR
jgi:NAD+ kinase